MRPHPGCRRASGHGGVVYGTVCPDEAFAEVREEPQRVFGQWLPPLSAHSAKEAGVQGLAPAVLPPGPPVAPPPA